MHARSVCIPSHPIPWLVACTAAGLRVASALSADELRALMGALAQEPTEYWAERGALAWN